MAARGPPKQPAEGIRPKRRPARGGNSGLAEPTVARASPPPAPEPSRGRWAQQLRIPPLGDPKGTIRRLLGRSGCRLKEIASRCGAKLRVRGIGSGHLEGRRRAEAQVPLHLCVSAPTEEGLRSALAEAKALIAQLTQNTGKGDTCKIRVALANEGKLSDQASLSLSAWAKEIGIPVCMVAEAALARTQLATEAGYAWAAPLRQRKGGSGFLMNEEVAKAGGKVKIIQCPERHWALSLWRTPGGTGLITVYISPSGSANREVLGVFLTKLEGLLETAPRCIVAGDFNAPSGSSQRRTLDAWSEKQGLSLANPGVLTHFARADHRGTDLDLILARGTTLRMLEAQDQLGIGHLRQVFEIEEVVEGKSAKAEPAPLAWGKLSCPRAQERFLAALQTAIRDAPSLDEGIQRAAEVALGRAKGPTGRSRRLPPAVRREASELRKKARGLPRGSPEYLEISRRIGQVMRRHRLTEWKATLEKLASSSAVEDDTWRLLKHLRKSSPTAQLVGIPDTEIRDSFTSIYQSNRVRRSDWSFSAPYGNADCGTGLVPELDAAFTSEEVNAALSSLPPRKAPGVDGIPHEAYKVITKDPSMVRIIAENATDLLEGSTVPPLEGRLVVIPKKGAPERAADMRPLMMLPSSRKVVEKLIAERLSRLAEKQGWDGMHPSQGGFRRGLCIERQLVLAQVTILDAQRTGRPLRMVGLDIVKAFDRIPKEFAAHCAASYLRRLCPKLAGLVTRLTLTPFEARVGNLSLGVHTGVPQGSILSPWLFAMAMNDLSLRLAGAGGYTIGEVDLGNLHFADDILQSDGGAELSEERLRLTKGWVEEWGGEIHPTKTEWLDVNIPTGSTPPFGLENPNGGSAIAFLGVTLTPKGAQPSVGAEVFTETLNAIRCTTEMRGLAPAPALQVLRSVAWAKIAHGVAVTLPDAVRLTSKWLAAARQVLCTFNQVHRAEVIKELGLLYHPLAWQCRAVIRVYGNALTTDRDPLLKRVCGTIISRPDHPLKQKIEAALKPTGVTWSELASVPVPDLLRKADGRLREWIRGELLSEATRLGLHSGDSAPLWQQWSDGPRRYLYEVNARYGFMFRRGSMSPPDMQTEPCHFCGSPGDDRGRHILACAVARTEVPPPRALAELGPDRLQQALLLDESCPPERLRIALEYMKSLYSARTAHRNKRPPTLVKRDHVSNPHFLRWREPGVAASIVPVPTAARRTKRAAVGDLEDEASGVPRKRGRHEDSAPEEPPIARSSSPQLEPLAVRVERRRKRSAPEDGAEITFSGFPPVPRAEPIGPPPERLSWSPGSASAAPTELLPSRKRPLACGEEPAASSSKAQRIRLVREELARSANSSAGPPPINNGEWSEEERERLAKASLLYGQDSPTILALYVQTRTMRQVKVRLTTSDHRWRVERLREAQKGTGGREVREPPLSGNEPTPARGASASAPPPGDDLGDIAPTSGRWTRDEHSRLITAIREIGRDAKAGALASAVGTRTVRQVLDRLREKSVQEELHGLLPLPPLGLVPVPESSRSQGLEEGLPEP